MRSVSILGVIVGGLFDIVVTTVLATLAVGVMAGFGFSDQNATNDTELLISALDSLPVQITTQAIGAMSSIIAGYIAAWIARRHQLLNGALSASLSVILSIGSLALEFSHGAAAWYVVGIVLSPCFGLLGGYLRLRRVRAITAVI